MINIKLLVYLAVNISLTVITPAKTGVIFPVAVLSPIDSLPFPSKDGKIVYERIVDVPGTSKDVLFKETKIWFVNTFKDSREVIKSEDKDAGEILGTGRTTIILNGTGLLNKMELVFNIRVSLKQDKYRIQMYDIIWDNDLKTNLEKLNKNPLEEPNKKQSERRDRFVQAINKTFYSLIEDFRISLAKSKSDEF